MKESKYFFYDTGAAEGDMGAKIENTVACALWRELYFIDDTTGSRVALHYLRDKERHEVDFLTVIDNVPHLLIEVKVSDDNFSLPLFRFHEFLKSAKPVQVVYDLRNKKSSSAAAMLPVHEFLAHLDFSTPTSITS